MAEVLDFKGLNTLDKIEHKNWKARVEGYEEALKAMQMSDSGKDPLFNPYLGLVKNMVIDSNAVAQEKALEVILLFVQEANVANKAANDICPGIVNKCFNSTRQKTRELAFEILKVIVEIERQDVVMEELIKGLSCKTPKVVVGSINVLKEVLRDFGPKIVPMKEMFKTVHKLLEDRDKNVREAGKELIIEMYRWIGSTALNPVLSQIKPVQVTELNAEFEKLPQEKPVPSRYLKSQKPKESALVKPTGGGDAVPQQSVGKHPQNNVDIDPYDLVDPVEVISKIPANYYDQIEEKKWTDRKDALEIIEKLTNNPKLVPGEYGDLMKSLLKVLSKDTNIVLVALSAKIIYQIATGLRKKFSPYAVNTIQATLEKFKEKKTNVVKALRDCIDSAFVTTSIDACMEELLNALNHKTPSVKSETALFLNRVFEKSSMEMWTGKLLKQIIPGLTNLCLDSVPEVRDAAFQTLGTAMKVVTEKKLKPYLDKMDNVKLARINEFYEKAKQASEATIVLPEKSAVVVAEKPIEPPKAEKHAEASKKPAQSKPAAKKPVAKSQKPGAASKVPEIPTESVMSEDDVTMKATDIFGEAFLAQIVDKNWKERSAAFETLQTYVKNQVPSDIPCQLIIRLILMKPGLKDNNNQVLKAKIELIKDIVTNGRMTWTTAEMCITDLTEKIGDIKNADNVKSTLTEMSDIINLPLVASQVIKTATENVNIKNLVEALNWLSDAIKDFGFKIPINDLVPFIRLAVQHTNPAVRQSGIKLAGTISLYVREVISSLLKDEKPSIKQLIDNEVESLKSTNPPVPTRGLKNETPVVENATDSEVVATHAVPELNLEDMIPRENITHKITDNLLAQLSDKTTKVKKESLGDVTKIISASAGISGDGLQGLIVAIVKSTTDSSLVISKMAINILVSLCNAFTKKDAERYIKIVVPALLSSFSDPKPKNREDAVTALNVWTEKVGFPNVVDGGTVTEALKVDNPYQKSTIFAWMSPHLTKLSQNKLPKKLLYPDFPSEILPHLFSAIEERSPDVRKFSQEAVLPFMLVFGYDLMVKNFKSSTKTSPKSTIMGFLDKAKAELPVPEPIPSKQLPKAASSNGKPPASKEAANKKASDSAKPKKEDSKSNEQLDKDVVVMALLAKNSNKKQRIQEDRKKKITKWETSLASSQQLNSQFSASCSPELFQLLFTTDIKKSMKAIELLNSFLSEDDKDSIEATKQNLDLILKWMVIRFNETNPSVLTKGLDYLCRVFTILCLDNSFQLLEHEVNGFIPELIVKMGDPKDQVRAPSQKILKLISCCYDTLKIVQFLEENLVNKTARVRQECADFLKYLIDDRKIDVGNQKNLLKSVALLISERDNNVRTAALNCLVSAHNFIGEDLLKILDSLHDKDRSMLLERIKRSGKPVSSETESSIQSSASTERTQKPSRQRENSATREQPKPQISQLPPKTIDINPLLKEEIGYKLINVDKEVEELLQPLEKITLRYSGKASQSVNSNDAITSVIHAINSNEVQTSIQAMAQIDEVIRNQDVRTQLVSYMDNLVMSITMQLKATLGRLSEEKFSESEITDMFKGMLATLVSIFNAKELAVELNRDRLMNLMQSILRIVINDQLVSLSEGGTIIRGINILSVRILESSNQTRMLSALLRMMSDCLKNGDTGSKYLNLIFKCIWSMTKNLVNTVHSIDLVVIFKDIQLFYTDFPPHIWEARESGRDVPLRTVKTLVYSIINNKGGGALEALYQISAGPNKDLETYIRKSYLKLNVPIPTVLPNPTDSSNIPEISPTGNKPKFVVKSNNRPYLEELKDIFGKIGIPEQNKQGLNDLYDFKLKYPYVDLSRYLSQTTPYFQRTIETGLKNIAEERGQPQISVYGSNQLNNSGAAASLDKDNLAYCNMDPESLLLRLKQLRKNAGLDKSNFDKTEKQNRVSSPTRDEMESSVISKLVPSGDGPVSPPAAVVAAANQMNNKRKMSAQDLAAIKQRFEALKRPN